MAPVSSKTCSRVLSALLSCSEDSDTGSDAGSSPLYAEQPDVQLPANAPEGLASFIEQVVDPLMHALHKQDCAAAEAVADVMVRALHNPAFDMEACEYMAAFGFDAALHAALDTLAQLHAHRSYVCALCRASSIAGSIFVGQAHLRTLIRRGQIDGDSLKYLVEVGKSYVVPDEWVYVDALDWDMLDRPFALLDKQQQRHRGKLVDAVPRLEPAGAAERFRAEWPGVADVLSPKLVAAGGAVLHAVAHCRCADVDLFLVGVSPRERMRLVQDAVRKIVTAYPTRPEYTAVHYYAVLTEGALTLEIWHDVCTWHAFEDMHPDLDSSELHRLWWSLRAPPLRVQFVLRMYRSVAQVLTSFDLPGTQFAFDGARILGTQAGLFSVTHRVTLPDPLMATTCRRARKYNNKGLAYAVPVNFQYTAIKGAVAVACIEDPEAARALTKRGDAAGVLALANLIKMREASDERNDSTASAMYATGFSAYAMVIDPEVRVAAEEKGVVLEPLGPDGHLSPEMLGRLAAADWRDKDPCARMYGNASDFYAPVGTL